MDKQFAVLGLGSFGSSVALTLENMGCDVLVVDESYEKVQEISDKVSYAVKADVSEPDALQALGGRNLDGVVVAISESLEASIMATMLCKEMGIPLVVAKAKDKLQGAILQRVGADRIVYPEIEMGSRRFQKDEKACVSFDGDTTVHLKVGDRIRIASSNSVVSICKLNDQSFLEILRKKMQR